MLYQNLKLYLVNLQHSVEKGDVMDNQFDKIAEDAVKAITKRENEDIEEWAKKLAEDATDPNALGGP